MNVVNDLTNRSIYWQRHPKNARYFYAYNDTELLLLRLNDFSDEPLLTLIKGLEITDIEEIPEQWIVPFK